MPIRRISFSGDAEAVWNWELYSDPEAPNYGYAPFGSVCTFDSPFNPWRSVNGIFAIAANSVNYKVPLDATLRPLRKLNKNDVIFNSGVTVPDPGGKFFHRGYDDKFGLFTGSCAEADYDHDFWIFSPWTEDGVTLHALCHHEYYPTDCPSKPPGGRHWIATIHHMESTDGGSRFLPQPYLPYESNGGVSNSWRTVLIPEPSDKRPRGDRYLTYGFYHPSNIVREGNYCYALCQANNWLGGTIPTDEGPKCLNEGGFVMIRTEHPSSPRGWQVFTPAGQWETTNKFTWQGFQVRNRQGQLEGQLVKLWHREEYCPYTTKPKRGTMLGLRLVYHRVAQQWIALGYAHEQGKNIAYTLTDSLANPNWENYGIRPVEGAISNVPLSFDDGNYPSIVDPTSEDKVFQFTGNNPFLYFVRTGSGNGPVTTNANSRTVYRVPLQIETT
jgi:hypothetical protein